VWSANSAAESGEDLQYYDSDNWRVQLHTDQYYLGRSLVVLKRHMVDINEMEDRER
jgi:diadenosine tetraphosphate (Ap4A) HIT family hydrolase